jgi:hypothetical protein
LREMLFKILGLAVLFLIILLFLFLFVDCKMDNAYLKARNDVLHTQMIDLNNELKGVQDNYSQLMAALIAKNQITMEDIASFLPAKEIQRIEQILQKK